MEWPSVGESSPLTWESVDVEFKLNHEESLSRWVNSICRQYGKELHNIHYIFCSDEFLLKINKEKLNHDFYTDIITFPLEEGEKIHGEAIISIDRVSENASSYNETFHRELYRVMAHAILHMIGLEDKNKSDRKIMREAEDEALKKLDEFINTDI